MRQGVPRPPLESHHGDPRVEGPTSLGGAALGPRSSTVLAVLLAAALSSAGPAGAQGFSSVYTRDAIDVWAVGDLGTYFRSIDGGINYQQHALGDKALRDVVARNYDVIVV